MQDCKCYLLFEVRLVDSEYSRYFEWKTDLVGNCEANKCSNWVQSHRMQLVIQSSNEKFEIRNRADNLRALTRAKQNYDMQTRGMFFIGFKSVWHNI